MAQISFISATKLLELVTAANPKNDMHVRVLTATQLALGADPLHPTSIIDLAKEVVRPASTDGHTSNARMPQPAPSPEPSQRVSRQSGRYLLEIKGKTTECRSLKELLSVGLKTLERTHPGTLERLSGIRPRTKRIVARDAGDLFDQPELVQKYAERLVDGWWYGTNNSAGETNTWLRRAADLSGLKWDRDISTSL